MQPGVKVYEYSRTEGDFHAENIRIDNGTITFDFVSPIENVKDVELGQPVPINIDNGIAAMAMAQLAGCTAEELKYGMKTYRGVDRRFDFKINDSRHVLLSDYAHHPKEIYQSAKSIRELYKGRHITAIFQPHLYTRTRDFYRDFADALSQLDEVILTEIYPAREQPIEASHRSSSTTTSDQASRRASYARTTCSTSLSSATSTCSSYSAQATSTTTCHK